MCKCVHLPCLPFSVSFKSAQTETLICPFFLQSFCCGFHDNKPFATAFLIIGIAGTQNIIGQPYVDKDNVHYLPMSQQPIMIHSASGEQMKELFQKALTKDVTISIYTEELFKTYSDEDNRAMVANFKTEELNLVGIGIRGKKNHVDRLLKRMITKRKVYQMQSNQNGFVISPDSGGFDCMGVLIKTKARSAAL